MPSHQRSIDWTSAMRDLSARRAVRPDVREERVAMRGLTAWRGASSRRYVASVRSLDMVEAVAEPLVLLAVHRSGADRATLITAASIRSPEALAGFLDLARATGAKEIHAHTLAADATARADVVRDLAPGVAYHPAGDRAPLASAEGYDRRAIMATAIGLARVARDLTGQSWAACMGPALRAAWAAARRMRGSLVS